MELALNDLTDKALSLPIDERTVLARRLWESIEGFLDKNIGQEWLDVVEKRWSDIENGSVQCIPAEEAIRRARTRINRKK